MSLLVELFGETIAIELREHNTFLRTLEIIERHNRERHKQIMSALSDLQTAISLLTANVASSRSAVLAAIADIQTLPANDAALVPLTAAVQSAATDLADQAAQLMAAVNASTPTPTPTP